MSHDDINGYTVAYEQEEVQFPVYVVIFVGVVLAACAIGFEKDFLFAIALIAFGYAYYNFPLLETGRPRLGAGQYGVFIDGLGIIGWKAIAKLESVTVLVRGVENNELHILLEQPLERALIADWRARPLYRILMRLPWSMPGADVVRVPLDIFDKEPGDIEHHFTRMMLFYRR